MERVEEREPPDVITGDTDNATRIPVNEAPSHKQEKFRCFRAYNTGLWNGPKRENTEAFRRQDDLHLFDSVSSSLDLTSYQKRRGRRIMDELNFHEMGKPIQHIAFGVCCTVANADVRGGQRYWPHEDWPGSDREFEQIADELDLTLSEQMSVVCQVKSRTNL